MATRLVCLVGVGLLVAWTAQAPAAQIPCDPGFQRECMTNFTCKTVSGSTFCSGEPKPDGTECTSGTPSECSSGPFKCSKDGACRPTVMAPDHTACTHDITGGCMLNAECSQGFCMGSVPAPDGTKCSFADTKCPGSCKDGSCQPQQNPCTQPSDPCMQSMCDPADGNCVETPKCAGTVSGCATCSAGVCQPARIDLPCTNSQGDFNSCTTGDRCVDDSALGGICKGVPISGIPCVGDCNHKHQVTVDNLITMSAIMLGDEPVDDCPAGDENNDRVITIDEEVKAEINAISGCP